ncbi:hypothetical protein PPMP20_18835 [Paraburkholderia phymatum]|uniref:Uncharacterized protein n=1 Tax=Paraburkholderia phymatum (strain DSM 17167 / CIP 108236 / LMG 21445 / STM815) TaxID=391038 RepID=B2JU68_PARP8|nr:hypothetical protein [Paraburkholderia phymatum]ACC76121.1 hypothetical protein Bphy_7120 [Paraburkholderia phymatum STM815]
MNGSSTNPTDDILRFVDEAGAGGTTAAVLVTLSGQPMNRVSAALTNLTYEGAVRREKIDGVFHYWYRRERPPAGSGKRGKGSSPKAKDYATSDVLLTLPLGRNESITTTVEGAKALYRHLHVLFGSK